MATAGKKTTRARRSPASMKRASPQLADSLAEAAWSEADAALAEAIICLEELELTRSGVRRAGLFALLGQALTRAARRRGLSRFGDGDAAFDSARHAFIAAPPRAPGPIEVVVRGVSRGGEVLAKARVRKPS